MLKNIIPRVLRLKFFLNTMHLHTYGQSHSLVTFPQVLSGNKINEIKGRYVTTAMRHADLGYANDRTNLRM